MLIYCKKPSKSRGTTLISMIWAGRPSRGSTLGVYKAPPTDLGSVNALTCQQPASQPASSQPASQSASSQPGTCWPTCPDRGNQYSRAPFLLFFTANEHSGYSNPMWNFLVNPCEVFKTWILAGTVVKNSKRLFVLNLLTE